MTTLETAPDEPWGRLADLDETSREEQMTVRYEQLVGLEAEDRRRRLYGMARAEYALSDEKLRSFTRSRLQVWLKMEAEAAKTIATSYDAVMTRMPGDAAMRRIAMAQTL